MPIGNPRWPPLQYIDGFPIGIKNTHFVEDLPMIILGKFGFNYPSGFREEQTAQE
jgi:hypothetical protein